MDSREFDELIKNSLSDFSQLPKKEVRRAVFGFLLFQNLWIFHKVKLFSALFLVAGVSLSAVYLFDNSSSNPVSSNIEHSSIEKPLNNSINKSTVLDNSVSEAEFNDEMVSKSPINSTFNNESSDNIASKINLDKAVDQPKELVADNPTDNFPEEDQTTEFVSKSTNSNIKTTNSANSVNYHPKAVSNKRIEFVDLSNSNENVLTKDIIESVDIEHEISNNDLLDAKINIKEISPLTVVSNLDSVVSVPTVTSFSNDYANNKFKRGVTADFYFSPFSMVDVDNVLDPTYQDYWWDFYKEYDMKKSGVSAGLNLSYNYRNIKINSGFNLSQVYDYKPVYDYYTKTDSIFVFSTVNELSLFSVDYISGLQVYGQDTAVILYVDPNDSRIIDEINNQDANRYSYFKIPLTIGYELSFKRFSFEINAGIEYSRLVKASGVSFKKGYVDVGIRPYPYYFYNDMVATTYSNNSQALKINNWNYVGNFISRVRITPSFDLYSSLNYQYQQQNIMSDSYLLEKTYKRFGFNFGATYYLNSRLSLKDQVTPKFQ
ncbi:MAG: hypothetical protein CL853_09835 [Crocinitomicaceae bacterium]|nr:hypothetical protein [Crocinitomicaceae bacterium]|tara:strand:+ start:1378 stop:3012 length:1635 start_codon:yes stop_codon:yes gene_type:complete